MSSSFSAYYALETNCHTHNSDGETLTLTIKLGSEIGCLQTGRVGKPFHQLQWQH